MRTITNSVVRRRAQSAILGHRGSLTPPFYSDDVVVDPTAPLNLVSTAQAGGSITLDWDAPAVGTPPVTYSIYYKGHGDSVYTLATLEVSPGNTGYVVSTTYAVVVALEANTSYDFYAVAFGLGTSPPSNIVTASTRAAEAPGRPRNLTPTGHTGTSVTLVWDAPVDNGGSPVTVYHVKKATHGNTPTEYTTSATTSKTVTGLVGGQAYDFLVTAENAVAEGAASDGGVPAEETTTATVPDPPTSLTIGTPTSTTLPVSWAAPVNTGDGTSLTYQVKYRVSGVDPYVNFGSPISGTSTTITGLTLGTAYDVEVFAINGIGASAASNVATGSTSSLSALYQYKLAEAAGANNALDSISGLALTVTGTPGSAAGIVGNCRTFGGSSDYFGVNVSGNKLQGNNGTTFNPVNFSIWYKTTQSSVGRATCLAVWRSSISAVLLFRLSQEGSHMWYFDGDNGGNNSGHDLGVVTANAWQHLALKINGSGTGTISPTISYRLNGGSVQSFTGMSRLVLNDPSGQLVIGGGSGQAWNGSIDAVALETGVLWTDAQLLAWYNSGNGAEI